MKKQKHQNQNKNKKHLPVLLDEVIKTLSPKEGDSYLDLTAGYGGHAKKVIEITKSPERATLVDRDLNAVEYLKSNDLGAKIVHKDFLSFIKASEDSYDMILMDLGVSSPHLDNAERGFSFKEDGPLDMRMDEGQKLSAEFIVNNYKQDDLANLIYQYGEERKSRKIARLIVENRPLNSTTELADVIRKAFSPGYHKKDPATRTFQAIRIAVNDELNQIERALPEAIEKLNPGGRLAVISFHSLEDRVVKQYFKQESESGYEATVKLVTKPIKGAIYDVNNPRARSSTLRAVVKINTQKQKERG